jgi:hypothetical protein
MRYKDGSHPDVDEMEKYLIGNTSPSEVEEIEEHLLLCEPCQSAFQQVEADALALKNACAKMERKRIRVVERPRRWWQMPVPATAIAATCSLFLAGGIALQYWNGSRATSPEADIVLSATRGTQGEASRSGVVGGRVHLHVDVSSLTPSSRYELEIVDENGGRVWERAVTPQGSALDVRVDKRLSAGQYWVRLKDPSGSVLQEFSLTVQ